MSNREERRRAARQARRNRHASEPPAGPTLQELQDSTSPAEAVQLFIGEFDAASSLEAAQCAMHAVRGAATVALCAGAITQRIYEGIHFHVSTEYARRFGIPLPESASKT